MTKPTEKDRKKAQEVISPWRDESVRVLCKHGYHDGCQECPDGQRIGPLRFVAPLDAFDSLITTIAQALADARDEAKREQQEEQEQLANGFLMAYDLAAIDSEPLPERLPESAYVLGYMDKVRELREVYVIAARIRSNGE